MKKYTICHFQADRKYKSSALLGQDVVEGEEEDLQEALEQLGRQGKQVHGWLEDDGVKVRAQSGKVKH